MLYGASEAEEGWKEEYISTRPLRYEVNHVRKVEIPFRSRGCGRGEYPFIYTLEDRGIEAEGRSLPPPPLLPPLQAP